MWQWVKACKGVALVAFFLPWMTVSCSGTELIRASGWGLASGHLQPSPALANLARRGGETANMGSAQVSGWLILALVAVVVGLVFAFRSPAGGARAVIASSLAAIALTLIGTWRIGNDAMAKAMAEQKTSDADFGAMAAAAIRIDWLFAYWLFLIALVGAAVLSWMALTGRSHRG